MDKYVISLVFLYANLINVHTLGYEKSLTLNAVGYLVPYPSDCYFILEEFAQNASNFTMCSIMYARPIKLCENCINQYVSFRDKYEEILNRVVNGTSCKSIFISHDRLEAVLEFHDNILNIWNKGHCNACYNWSTSKPVLSNETNHFISLYNETLACIKKNLNPAHNNSEEVCDACMQSYLQLDIFYKTLSADSMGLDSVCMDVVDAMNATRSIWSKSLNCCKVRQSPELIFLCCSGVISILPLLYYVVLRYFGPIRDLPNVLKQSRFKQRILRSINAETN